MDLLDWAENPDWTSLTEAQRERCLRQMDRVCDDIDARYPDPGDQPLREMVLHKAMEYLLGYAALEQFGRELKGRENVTPGPADDLRVWPNPQEALAAAQCVAVMASADGVPELATARALGVDWTTVQSWLGKDVPRTEGQQDGESDVPHEYLDGTVPAGLAGAFLGGECVRSAVSKCRDHGHVIAWSEVRRYAGPDRGVRYGVMEEDFTALHYWDYPTLDGAVSRYERGVQARADTGAPYDEVDGAKRMDVLLRDLDDDLEFPTIRSVDDTDG